MRKGRDPEVHLRVTEWESRISYMQRVAEPVAWIPKEGVHCKLLPTTKVLYSPRLKEGMDCILIAGWRRVKRVWGGYKPWLAHRRSHEPGAYQPDRHAEPRLRFVDYTYRVYVPELDATYSMWLRDLGAKKGETPWWEFRAQEAIKDVKFEVLEPSGCEPDQGAESLLLIKRSEMIT